MNAPLPTGLFRHDTAEARARHAGRRARLAQRIAAEGGGVAVLLNAPERQRNRDNFHPYRFDSHFYWLTGFAEPDSAVMLEVDASGAQRATLFCRPKDPDREIWDGLRWGPEAAREHFGFDDAKTIDALDAEVAARLGDVRALWLSLGTDPELDARARRWLDGVRARARSGVTAPDRLLDVLAPIDEMRLFKDEAEIALMREAGRIAADAHVRAMLTTRPGMSEFQVEAELLHEFRRRGAQSPSYSSIVAGGANACILHYRENDAELRAGTLLLIDAGCELDGYASDITRTFPVDGTWTGGQRALYDVVLASQHAAIAATRPGATFVDPHDAAVRVLVQGLVDLKLLAGEVDGLIESGAYKRFYMHRTGHWLGMDVHDVGDYREPGAAASGERPWRVLRPGMVLTIEPGLYVRAADDIPAEFHDIGIRIEDDALVTEGGCEILTAGVPKEAGEIAALMAEGRNR